MRKHGFNWQFQYFEPFDDIDLAAKTICSIKPEIVGLTATSSDFNKVILLSSKIKSAYNPLILLGGAHITSVPQTLPRNVDVGFLGEAEETIVDVFKLINDNSISTERLKGILGIVFFDEEGKLQINQRRPFQRDLDSFPLPARDIFSRDYWKDGCTSILTSRGCPYHCAFCQVTAEWRICRYHSAKYVVQEIQELVTTYGIHTVMCVDDLFIANRPRIRAIIELMREAGLLGRIRFSLNGRANLIDEELVQLLAEMGTYEIALGMESMSPKILSFLKDRVTVEDNVRAVDILYKFGLTAGGLFMLGTPGETIEDMALTYDYIGKNRHKFGGMQICVTTPLPNTPLWDLSVRKGLIEPNLDNLDWDKLNVAAEDLRTNLYVGDLEIEQFARVLRKFKRLFYEPNFIDYAKSNYIEAGRNESETVMWGNYPTETGPQGKVFWTNGHLQGIMKPEGSEDRLTIEFLSGVKTGKSDRYRVEVSLIDNEKGLKLFNQSFNVPQSCWCKEEFEIPVMKGVKSLKVIVKTDTFVPKDAGKSIARKLGIAIKRIFLRQSKPLLPRSNRVGNPIRISDVIEVLGGLYNFHDDGIWTRGNGIIKDIVYERKPSNSRLVLCTKGWHPFRGDLAKLSLRILVNASEQKFSHQENNAYYFDLDKSIKDINEIQIMSSTFKPKELGMSNDDRDLGIDVDYIRID